MATRQILLAVGDDDARARAQARAVADLFDPEDTAVVVHHDFVDNPEGARVDQVGSVRRARETLTDAGFDVTLAESSGDPVAEIIDVASDLDVDCICVGSRRRSPTGKAVFGSTTQQVLLDADRPVLAVPDGAFRD
ncbi:universal stress protein [Halorarius litoreus]|uniref:universal stress protein n=1 Tax=Halorarius litoreus TaxID=2962676 RepID=UPI0020CE5241|nr:universal stress protein [Halorarius litoreus]